MIKKQNQTLILTHAIHKPVVDNIFQQWAGETQLGSEVDQHQGLPTAASPWPWPRTGKAPDHLAATKLILAIMWAKPSIAQASQLCRQDQIAPGAGSGSQALGCQPLM